jgi:soluble lytic murein transglycosylase-like protein
MSTQLLTPASSGEPADAVAAAQRVQQLQALIAQTGPGSSTSSFAAALAAASAGPAASPDAAASASPEAGESTAVPIAGGQSAALSATTPATGGLAPAAYASAVSPYESAVAPYGASTELASASVPASGPALASGSPGSTAYDATIAQAAARYGLDPAVLHGLIQQESGFDPSAQSSAGALGLTQLMPATAASLGVTEPLDPTQSIEGGARYLSEMLSRFGGNTADALAAYNAGAGAVERYGGVPPYAETQEYVAKVMANANAYRQAASATPAAASATPVAPSSTPVGVSRTSVAGALA